MKRDYYYPKPGDRLEPAAWAEAGTPDAWIRDRFDILSA